MLLISTFKGIVIESCLHIWAKRIEKTMKTNYSNTILNLTRFKSVRTIISNQIIENLCIIEWVELRNCRRLMNEIEELQYLVIVCTYVIYLMLNCV